MDELPQLYSEDEVPESQKRSKLAIGLLVFILLLLPVGVVMTLRSNNDIRSNASSVTPKKEAQTSMQLLSPESTVNNQTIFPVDVLIQSDQEPTNFFVSHINFPPEKLEVVSIATTSTDLNDQTKDYFARRWIDASFDNSQGIINLAAGSDPPGLKTSNLPEQKKSVLATIFFKSRNPGPADITLQPGSMILKSEDNADMLSLSKSLNLQIKDSVGDFADKSYVSQAELFVKPQESTSESSLKLLSPIGGEVYSYYKPVSIKWEAAQSLSDLKTPKNPKQQSNQLKLTTISLLMNDQFLGQLTQIPGNATEFQWDVQKTLPLDYVKSENSFKIEIQTDIDGKKVKTTAEGPFSVLAGNITARQLTAADLGPDRTDLNGDGSVDFKDASFLLNQFFRPVTLTNKKSDINNDLEINDIDLWFLRQSFHLK